MAGVSRQDHLAWCKERALEYVDSGDLVQAITSMISDLGKHPKTADHAGITLGAMEFISYNLDTPAKMRRHIEGYN